MTKKHIEFMDAVSKMTDAKWGMDGDDQEVFEHFSENPAELSAYATLELLRRLNKLAECLGGPRLPELERDDPDYVFVPQLMPDVSIGQILYSVDGTEMTEYVVIGKKDDGQVMVSEVVRHFNSRRPPDVRIVEGWMDLRTSRTEALKECAGHAFVYWTALVNNASAILSAIEAGESVEDMEM